MGRTIKARFMAPGLWLILGLVLALAAPDRARAAGAVSLGAYDCGSVGAGQTSVRRLGQIIDGAYQEWREYVPLTAAGAADPGALPTCLETLKPEARFLTRGEAEALLTRSLGPRPTAAAAAPPAIAPVVPAADDPTVTAPAEPTKRALRGSEPGGAPALKKPGAPRASQASTLGTATQVVANDNRKLVADTMAFPFNTVVYLVSEYPNGTSARCSGVLVSPYIVMTAGHCVHNNQRGGYATKVTVAPGQYQRGTSPARPFGSAVATQVVTTLAWQVVSGPETQSIGNYKFDLASVRLAAPFTFTGTFMPVVFNDPAASAVSAGYPASIDTTGATNYAQYSSSGAMTADTSTYRYHALGLAEYQIAVSGGNSGGPYWSVDALGRRLLVGITSYGDDATGTSGGPYYSDYDAAQVSAWLTWTPSTPVVEPQVAANTVFAQAAVLAGPSGQATGSNAGALIETGSPQAAGSGGQRIVWWKWTAPRTGYVTIDTVGSSFDTVLGVYTGAALGQLRVVAANDDIVDQVVIQSRVKFLANAGVTYAIGVDGYSGDMGAITLNWAMDPALYPDTGWYFQANGGGGRGFAIETSPNVASAQGRMFLAAYQYDDAGKATWFVATLAPVQTLVATPPDGPWLYAGALTAYRLDTSGPVATTLGTVTLDIAAGVGGAPTGTRVGLTWPDKLGGGRLVLDRYPIDGKAVAPPAAAILPQRGWWVAPGQPGRGLMVEVQGTTLFMGWFGYRADGTAVWYAAGGPMDADGAGFTGALSEYAGGPSFTAAGAGLQTAARGQVGLRFTAPDALTMTNPDGTTLALTRFSAF